jgi:hypothetical protein
MPLLNKYSSEYGWSISLPQEWVAKPSPAGALTPFNPIAFVRDSNVDVRIIWMVRTQPVAERAVADFAAMLAMPPGPADLIVTPSIVNPIFPLIGEADEATIIALSDGMHALETVETYTYDSATHRGYQLILPLTQPTQDVTVYQRLCFYALKTLFNQQLEEVRAAARSFQCD